MWTKQFSLDGKAFYYNAAINRSCWAPPPDAIIHEAPNARPFTEEEIEQIRNEEAYKSFTNSTSVGTDANLIQPSINTSFPNNPMPVQSTINSRLGMVPNFYQVGTNMNSGSSFPAEDGLLEEK